MTRKCVPLTTLSSVSFRQEIRSASYSLDDRGKGFLPSIRIYRQGMPFKLTER